MSIEDFFLRYLKTNDILRTWMNIKQKMPLV